MRISDLKNIVRSSASSHSPASGWGKNGRPGITLVLGNEEAGLPKDVKAQCSHLLRIPGTGNIDSLNVSQAAALFLHIIYEL